MKRIIAVLVVVMSLWSVAGTSAQDFPSGTVTVDGFGQVFGAPDLAFVQLGVQSNNEDVLTAFNDTTESIQRVIAALTELGIDRADIQTTGLSLYQDIPYDPSSGAPSETPIYHAQNSVNVTVRDVSMVAAVIEAGVEAGANTINGLSFGFADRSTLEQQAREAAVSDAQARAEQLASLLEVNLGKASIIVETVNNTPPIIYNRTFDMLESAPSPVQEGQLTVSVQVRVTFDITAE